MEHDHFGTLNEDEGGAAKAIRGFWHNVLDVFLNVAIIVAIVTVVRSFVVSPFEVEGSSMVPSLEDSQYIIINKFGYIFGEPQRGDVVVFRPPGDEDKYYVKRIIGLPGETIIIRDGSVYVQEEQKEILLNEDYLDERNRGKTYGPRGIDDQQTLSYTVPQGSYFLLGDNRQGSLDSRSFRDDQGEPHPYVAAKSISGRVWLVALPIKKSHALETPEYQINQD